MSGATGVEEGGCPIVTGGDGYLRRRGAALAPRGYLRISRRVARQLQYARHRAVDEAEEEEDQVVANCKAAAA